MRLSFYLLFISNIIFSQSISELKTRFNTYLNFNSSLDQSISFSDKSVSIKIAGKPDFTIYEGEQEILSALLKNKTASEFIPIYQWKKNNRLSKKQIDSLTKTIIHVVYLTSPSLVGKRIAIDPGHFAGNVTDARVEQKFIDFSPSSSNLLKDTVRFNEGKLTYQTATILKHKLEEQGAIVMVTRPQQNFTAFQITYDTWFVKRKKIILDSLVKSNNMDSKRYSILMKLTKQKLFWEFFRDFELGERARIINEFKPDATVIIHYNVDEKNTDWVNPTTKNYTMTFIGGGMTADNFSKTINKIHFLRLLLTNQLNQSEKLASLTVNQFNKELHIPIAQKHDADYLRDNCLKTSSSGVFCRNLALCRMINSPLVYGEALYQDNINECNQLCKNDYEIYNQIVPKRIYETAMCYYQALSVYFSKP